MEYGKIPGIDKPISRLVQGSVMISTDDLDGSFELLDSVYALGCTTFDMAHGYGGGKVERAFGEWLKARNNRDDVVIITKGAHHNQDRERVTPYDIEADIHDSIARLGTDFFDLYILHRDNPSLPVGPIVEILHKYKEQGVIGVVGGSNWSAARIQEANAYAEANGLTPFTVSSPNFSLAIQKQPPWDNCISISGPEWADDRAYYIENNTPLFTWSSLAGGFFSGRLTRDNLGSFDEYLDKLAVDVYATEENFKKLDRVQELGDEKGLSIPQVVTAYVMSHPLNIFALVGCRNADEYKSNMDAMSVKLSPEEMAWLELRSDER